MEQWIIDGVSVVATACFTAWLAGRIAYHWGWDKATEVAVTESDRIARETKEKIRQQDTAWREKYRQLEQEHKQAKAILAEYETYKKLASTAAAAPSALLTAFAARLFKTQG